MQFIDARDLAEWTIRLAEQRTFGTYHATGPVHELTMARMLDGIGTCDPFGCETNVGARGFSGSPQSLCVERHARLAAGHRRRRRVRAARQPQGNRRWLRFRPLTSTATDTLAWFRAQPAERQAKLRAGLAPTRESEVLAAWMATRSRT